MTAAAERVRPTAAGGALEPAFLRRQPDADRPRRAAGFTTARRSRRPELVRLFAGPAAARMPKAYMLVTPAEKLSIAVEDVPFIAMAVAVENTEAMQRLIFTTNVGDVVVAGRWPCAAAWRTICPICMCGGGWKRGWRVPSSTSWPRWRCRIWIAAGRMERRRFLRAGTHEPLDGRLARPAAAAAAGHPARDDDRLWTGAAPMTTPPVKAAVLLPMILRAEPMLLFTRRTAAPGAPFRPGQLSRRPQRAAAT